MPVHHRLRFLTFPMRTSRLCSLWPDMRPLRFRRVPFGRDVAFDPGGATASRIAMPHMLPSTVPSVSASAKLLLSWLNPPPHPITVYASHPPSPTTAQHSLPGSALPPYRGRSFTGRIASASPDAPEPSAQRHLGRCENRSGDHRCLPSTGGTLVKRPGLDEAVMLPCANRADKAGWPAPPHHRLPALILCSVKNSKLGLAEPLLKLHLVARHRSNPQKHTRMFLFCTIT
jgi:hypothetical protein